MGGLKVSSCVTLPETPTSDVSLVSMRYASAIGRPDELHWNIGCLDDLSCFVAMVYLSQTHLT